MRRLASASVSSSSPALDQVVALTEDFHDRVRDGFRRRSRNLVLDAPGGGRIPFQLESLVDGDENLAKPRSIRRDDDAANVRSSGDQPLADPGELDHSARVHAPGARAVLAWHLSYLRVDAHARERFGKQACGRLEPLARALARGGLGRRMGEGESAFVKHGRPPARETEHRSESGISRSGDGGRESGHERVLLAEREDRLSDVEAECGSRLARPDARQERVRNRGAKSRIWRGDPD